MKALFTALLGVVLGAGVFRIVSSLRETTSKDTVTLARPVPRIRVPTAVRFRQAGADLDQIDFALPTAASDVIVEVLRGTEEGIEDMAGSSQLAFEVLDPDRSKTRVVPLPGGTSFRVEQVPGERFTPVRVTLTPTGHLKQVYTIPVKGAP